MQIVLSFALIGRFKDALRLCFALAMVACCGNFADSRSLKVPLISNRSPVPGILASFYLPKLQFTSLLVIVCRLRPYRTKASRDMTDDTEFKEIAGFKVSSAVKQKHVATPPSTVGSIMEHKNIWNRYSLRIMY